ncbi:NUDIX hydrolase [Pseudalkalibacillus caeni]|uniref:NUDIX domain-containing protein n=1 Tax=Exobacillus caeni TaxID=2574798 RepID=A0A5R9F6U4_9BACL|nr:NUDIX domain-containing protein [Pseudalkalibacillus caeni]TLS36553.1 NUDIX domain-containing protein [Pseudalkalibacillus caeni]
MMKKLSAGLVLTAGEKFLGCHSTGNWFYDLPKGEVGPDEDPKETCIREAKEETDLDLSEHDLIDIGVFDYNPKKNLHLFLAKVEEFPPVDAMSCSSCFIHPYSKKETMEVDGYNYISFSEKEKFLTKNMAKVLDKVEQIVINKKSGD